MIAVCKKMGRDYVFVLPELCDQEPYSEHSWGFTVGANFTHPVSTKTSTLHSWDSVSIIRPDFNTQDGKRGIRVLSILEAARNRGYSLKAVYVNVPLVGLGLRAVSTPWSWTAEEMACHSERPGTRVSVKGLAVCGRVDISQHLHCTSPHVGHILSVET